MGNLRRKLVGKKDFSGSVDITDPCYDRDVWCRMNDIHIKNGSYYCYIWKDEEGCIGRIGIYLDGIIPRQNDMSEIGTIGVDAGLAGFFHEKPDFNDNEWDVFCENIRGDVALDEYGFYSSSGYGDGEYPVYAHGNEQEYDALEIAFL